MGAALEFLETGRNGWLIPAADEEAILNAMREAASLPTDILTRLGNQARESVSAHTLQNGAMRFLHYSYAAIDGWSHRITGFTR